MQKQKTFQAEDAAGRKNMPWRRSAENYIGCLGRRKRLRPCAHETNGLLARMKLPTALRAGKLAASRSARMKPPALLGRKKLALRARQNKNCPSRSAKAGSSVFCRDEIADRMEGVKSNCALRQKKAVCGFKSTQKPAAPHLTRMRVPARLKRAKTGGAASRQNENASAD